MEYKKLTGKELNGFYEYLFDDEKSPATIEKYMRDVKKFILFIGKRTITKKMVIEYKEKLSRTYTITSANSIIAALNVFFQFLGRKDLHLKKFSMQKKDLLF